MTPAELRAVSRLGGHAFAGLVSRIEQVHQAIAGRAFAPAGLAGAPARLIHDSVARGAYLAVRGVGMAAGTAGGEAGFLLAASGRPAGREPAGNLALAALNVVAGDRLEAGLAPLAIRMAVRAAGCDVGLTAPQIAAAFPHATPRLAVFVHGLAETENSWHRRGSQSMPYGRQLQAEYGYTPVYVRYNTGRHISSSGHDLAGLLDALAAAWPEPVEEILLVGHSMGGLVIRSACHYGREASAAWVECIRHIFYLGSPHLGAPLARAAGLAGWAMGLVPETRPFATLAAGPASVRDLRHGYLLDDDWAGCDQGCCLADHRCDAPLLAGANHYAISATVTTDPGSPAGAVLGDLLVQPASAHGRRGPRQHIPFPLELGRRLGGMHHFDLLNHPDVWEVIRGFLRPAG
jgi:triacylglycerol esterase/lipase EstA (alpha/beta hydrolase family)